MAISFIHLTHMISEQVLVQKIAVDQPGWCLCSSPAKRLDFRILPPHPRALPECGPWRFVFGRVLMISRTQKQRLSGWRRSRRRWIWSDAAKLVAPAPKFVIHRFNRSLCLFLWVMGESCRENPARFCSLDLAAEW